MKRLALTVIAASSLMLAACGGGEEPAKEEATTSAKQEETNTSAPANVAEGVDPENGPQEWFDETVYRANNCASQNLTQGGEPICAINGVDTDKGGAMLVGYIDQDKPGVQDHFQDKTRQDMMVQTLADRVTMAKSEGDKRVQHVTDVRIIATGGEGFGSGWQGETSLG